MRDTISAVARANMRLRRNVVAAAGGPRASRTRRELASQNVSSVFSILKREELESVQCAMWTRKRAFEREDINSTEPTAVPDRRAAASTRRLWSAGFLVGSQDRSCSLHSPRGGPASRPASTSPSSGTRSGPSWGPAPDLLAFVFVGRKRLPARAAVLLRLVRVVRATPQCEVDCPRDPGFPVQQPR